MQEEKPKRIFFEAAILTAQNSPNSSWSLTTVNGPTKRTLQAIDPHTVYFLIDGYFTFYIARLIVEALSHLFT